MILKILSKSIFKQVFTCKPLILSIKYEFYLDRQKYTYQPLKVNQDNQLHIKIIALNNIQSFDKLMRQKVTQFDVECHLIASKTLIQILKNYKQKFFKHTQILQNYVKSLQTLHIQTLQIQQFGQILRLLRKIKMFRNKQNSNKWVLTPTFNIINKATKHLQYIQNSINIKQLIYFYKQLYVFNHTISTKIAVRLNQLIYFSPKQEQLTKIQLQQVLNILKIMMNHAMLYNDTQIGLIDRLIKILIHQYYSKLSIVDLVRISLYMNEIQVKVVDRRFSKQMQIINQKLLKNINIDQVQDASMLMISKYTHLNNTTNKKIYLTVFDKIFQTISPKGLTSFNTKFTFQLFQRFAAHVKLQITNNQNQLKFFNFIARQLSNPKFYLSTKSYLQRYIILQFFNSQQLKKIVQILLSYSKDYNYFNVIHYQISNKNVDITKILNYDRVDKNQIKYGNSHLIRKIVTLDNLIQLNDQNKFKYQLLFKQYKQIFINQFIINIQGLQKIFNQEKYYYHIYKYFNFVIKQKLSYLFVTQQAPQSLSVQQQLAKQKFFKNIYIKYLKYLLFVEDANIFQLSTKAQLSNVGILNIKALTVNLFLLKDHLCERVLTNIFTLYNQNFKEIIKCPKFSELLKQFLETFANKIFRQHESKILTYKIQQLIDNILENIQQKETYQLFNRIFIFILKSRTSRNQSDKQNNFLKKLLNFVQYMKQNSLRIIFRQALNFDIISRQMLPLFTPNIRQMLPRQDNQRLDMIAKDLEFLKDNQITNENTYRYLSHKLYRNKKIPKKHSQKIMGLIQVMNFKQIWKCIIRYQLGFYDRQVEILQFLFKNLNNKLSYSKIQINYKQMSPLKVLKMLDINEIKLKLSKCVNIKTYLQYSLQCLKQKHNFEKLSFSQHLYVIKQASHYIAINNQYMHTCLEHQKINFEGLNARSLYLIGASMNFQFNTEQLNKLIQNKFYTQISAEPFKSLDIFIQLEQKIKNPSYHLGQMIKNYKKKKNHKQINKIVYEYLRANYSDKCMKFLANHIINSSLCVNFQTIHYYMNNLKQTIQQVFGQKFIQQVLYQNYYYTFKNYTFIFCKQQDNNLMKKIMTKLTKINNIICITYDQINSLAILNYLGENCNDLFTLQKRTLIYYKLEYYNKIQDHNQQSSE